MLADPQRPELVRSAHRNARHVSGRHTPVSGGASRVVRGHASLPRPPTGCPGRLDNIVAGSASNTRALLNSTDDLLRELASRLTGLVGTDGYRALLVHALHVANADFPVLRLVHVAESGSGHLVLEQHSNVAPSDVLQFEHAAAAVISHLVQLVEEFLGPDLVQGILRESWSAASEL